MNPLNPKQMQRLRSAMKFSYKQLEPFRRVRMDLLRQYVGFNYSASGSTDKVAVNMVKMATNIYARLLSSRTPRALVKTEHNRLKPLATLFQLDLDHVIDEIDLHQSLKIWLLESLISFGCMKVGLVGKAEDEEGGILHDAGQPYADPVYLDDWVHDMSALRWEQVSFCGNKYKVDLEWAKDTDMYDKKAREELMAANRWDVEDFDWESAQTLSGGLVSEPNEYKDKAELWDIWLPEENLFITMSATNHELPPLRVSEWKGPERGPYHVLAHYQVPANTMPLPPAADWLDMHDIVNRLFRKLARQAERQKTILGVQGGAAADGRRIQNANDGDMYRLDNPSNFKEYNFGGINQQNMAFMIFARNLLKEHAGNIDALGGLGGMTDTARQDSMISQAAGVLVEEMQDNTVSAVGELMKAIGHYEWNDPTMEKTLHLKIPGLDNATLPVPFNPDVREGDFMDYNISIHPYSMKHDSPQTKLQTIMNVWERIVMPLMQSGMMQQQGASVNVEGFMRTVARLSNMDELDEIIVFGSPPPEESGHGVVGSPSQQGSRMPSNTTRRYERVSKPGASVQGRDEALMQHLLGGGQDAGLASLTRALA